MNREHLVYLAGWLEGEGSFVYSGGGLSIAAVTVDEDIAELGHTLLECPRYGPYPLRSGKLAYQVRCSGANAAGWMMMLYNFMGIRRRTQIKKALGQWREQGVTPGSLSRQRRKFTFGRKK